MNALQVFGMMLIGAGFGFFAGIDWGYKEAKRKFLRASHHPSIEHDMAKDGWVKP